MVFQHLMNYYGHLHYFYSLNNYGDDEAPAFTKAMLGVGLIDR